MSISTVSYALSGKRSIAASTKQRIDEAVLELDYRANAGARMLNGSYITITVTTDGDSTVVTSDSAAPFRARLAGGTTVVAADRKALL
ncbi:LacI family DNA-binding transcriptional regulator [Cryobacterium sp. SO1]|uniref:LacI family DNA-binding transcriptional regulator n=1 Tax=Cryobacterium sp. SO1 TaxID=1897061 RepID=UPI001022CB11|nr:hypothetical protein BJQ95_01312 [Cryobacterium sp. SO1]